VIDRWHLLKNLREAAERLCNRVRGQVDAIWNAAPPRVSVYARATQRYQNEVNAGLANRAKRLRQYEHVRQLKAQGSNISQIARRVPLALGTARKYYHAQQFPERKRHRRHPSALDPFVQYLQARFDQGCENAMQLWREIQGRGYTRGPKAVRQWVRLRRTRPAPTTEPARQALKTMATACVADLPSTRALAWLLTRAPAALTDDEGVVVNALRQHESLDRAYGLVQRFARMTRERKGGQLEQWIQDAVTSDVKEVKTFAVGLLPDQPAVHAAMTHPWSNGPTEGHVNRLKLIKRQMFGRANFDLLRIRVLHAPRSTNRA
jgi:transposase